MLKDGHHDRALMALQSVDLGNKKTDLARFYTLQGLAYLGLNDLSGQGRLQQAVKTVSKIRRFYLSNKSISVSRITKTIDAIGKAEI